MYAVMQRRQEEYRRRRSYRYPWRTCPRRVSVVDGPYESSCDKGFEVQSDDAWRGLTGSRLRRPPGRVFCAGTVHVKRIIVVDRVSNDIYTSDSGHDPRQAMHRIGFVVFPNFYLLGFAAVTAFELANVVLGERAYEVTVLSEQGGLVASSAGIRVETQPFGDTAFDTVMFGSGVEIDIVSAALTAFVRRALTTSRRIAAPCTGAFILAEAGVLEGRRVTTHWRFARDLQRRFPAIAVEEDQIFIVDGPIWTSAGMAATI